ncbi:hypothetical protein IBT49_14065 [Erwinia sp. S63]|uniref:T6SS effector BTH_I2691 family protein n=1 Tax=Erwinia sp. S63 TaxID=2769341 RepID=UPI00190C95EC|nr:T6SS effector BTH_I2691 family protein [Erwinia sp. S63]MBK0097106.1 hypothetical protein [Erwinia sp. S63]
MACNNECNSTGLAILPVRYAVVPKTISTTLPAWAQSAPVTGVPLDHGDHYALRAMRRGFLYLFYAQGPQGSNYWQCYSIADDGSLWLQSHAEAPVEQSMPSCFSKQHDAAMVEFFCIAEPEKCGDVWLAFSQHAWSETTLNRYKQESAARDARMQKIQPAQWMNQAQQAGATQANAQSLQSVIEYQDVGVENILPSVNFRSFVLDNTISTPSEAESRAGADNYGFNQNLLERVSTLYSWALTRRSKSAVTAEKMQSRSLNKDGKACPPLLLPLWDAVGIVHELNCWSMDVAGRQTQFFEEKAFELKTHTDLTTVQGLLSDAASADLSNRRSALSRGGIDSTQMIEQRAGIRSNFAERPEMQNQLLSECDEVEQWQLEKVPTDMYQSEMMRFNMKDVTVRKGQFAALKQKVEAWKATYPGIDAEWRKNSWKKYEARLNTQKRQKFVDCYTTFSAQIKAEYEARVANVVKWLEAKLFIATLQDYKTTEFMDNYRYASIVSVAISGISNTAQGVALLDRWVQEQSTANDSNLVWNTVAGNNPEIKSELEVLLSTAKSHNNDTDPTSTPALLAVVAKAGDLKKYTGFVSKAIKESAKALPENADWLNRTFGKSDLFLATVGERVFNFGRLGNKLDGLVHTIYKTIFSLRAGVPYQHFISHLDIQFREMPKLRSQILHDLQSDKRFLPENKKRLEKYRELNKSWDTFSESDDGRTALKTSRLGLLMLFLNGLDLAYLTSQLKENDLKSQAALAASGLSALSLISDLVLPAFEKGGASAVKTIESIKLSGALLGATASVATVYLDFKNIDKENNGRRFGLVAFYSTKTLVDAIGVAKYLGQFLSSVGTLATVSRTNNGRIAQFALQSGEKIGAGFLARTGAMRLLGILASWQVQVGLILLQVIITSFSDDDLQVWCTRCIYGKKPSFGSYDEQLISLQTTLKEIL